MAKTISDFQVNGTGTVTLASSLPRDQQSHSFTVDVRDPNKTDTPNTFSVGVSVNVDSK